MEGVEGVVEILAFLAFLHHLDGFHFDLLAFLLLLLLPLARAFGAEADARKYRAAKRDLLVLVRLRRLVPDVADKAQRSRVRAGSGQRAGSAMSVRRGASASQPLVGRRSSSRLDAVLRAGQAHGASTGTKVAPEGWAPRQDRGLGLLGPRAKIAVENVSLNRAALARARNANQRARVARAAAASAQTAYVPLQAEANASDQPLSAEEARTLREMGAKIVDLQREAETASNAMRQELREAKRLGDEARAELAQVRDELEQQAAAKGGADAALRAEVDAAMKQLDDARVEVAQLTQDAARQEKELAEGQARLEKAEASLAKLKLELDAAKQSGASNKEEMEQLRAFYEDELSNLRNTLSDEQRQREDAARIAELEAYAPERMNEARDQLQNLSGFQNAVNQLEENLEDCEAEFDALKAERDALVRAQHQHNRELVLPNRRAPVAAPSSPRGLNNRTMRLAVQEASKTNWVHAEHGPIAGWDVRNVTNMSSMFKDAAAFNGDLSGWDVRNVTDMRSMFDGAAAFNGDLRGWDVRNVTDMRRMFCNAASFNGDLSGWDVRNVTSMSSMFFEAASFNGDLSGWDVRNVRRMWGMFFNAAAFNGDLSGWDVRNVTNMGAMFLNTPALNPKPAWYTGSD